MSFKIPLHWSDTMFNSKAWYTIGDSSRWKYFRHVFLRGGSGSRSGIIGRNERSDGEKAASMKLRAIAITTT